VYEPPRIEAVSRHFVPDNSGNCCPICGDGVSCEPLYCEECRKRDHTNGPYDREAQEKREMEWFGDKMWRFAEAVPDEGALVCEADLYPIRHEDGTGYVLCYYCLTRNHDIAKIKYCPICGIFAPVHLFKGDNCKWCTKHGAAKSRLLANGMPLDVIQDDINWSIIMKLLFNTPKGSEKPIANRRNGWFGEEELAAELSIPRDELRSAIKKIDQHYTVGENECNCKKQYRMGMEYVAGLAIRKKTAGQSTIQKRNKYEELVNLLDTPKWRPMVAEFLLTRKDDADDFVEDGEVSKGSLADVFEELGITFARSRNYLSAIDFIAREEAERFARDPAVRAVFLGLGSGDPMMKLNYVLSTGQREDIGTEVIESIVKEIIPGIKTDDLWSAIKTRFQMLPDTLIAFVVLENPRLFVQERRWEYLDIPVYRQMLSDLGKSPMKMLALLAVGFWHRPYGPAHWWLPMAQVLRKESEWSLSDILGRARNPVAHEPEGFLSAALGIFGIRSGRTYIPSEDSAVLKAFIGKESCWGIIGTILAGRGIRDKPFEWRINRLFETVHLFDVLKDLEPLIERQIQETGGKRYVLESLPFQWDLQSYLYRTGQKELLLDLYIENLPRFWTDSYIEGGFCEFCLELRETVPLRIYLNKRLTTLQKEIDSTVKAAGESCVKVLPLVEDLLMCAYLDGLLNGTQKMRSYIAAAFTLVENRIRRCKESGLPYSVYDYLLGNMQASEESLNTPVGIINFMGQINKLKDHPEEYAYFSDTSRCPCLFHLYPGSVHMYRQMAYLLQEKGGQPSN